MGSTVYRILVEKRSRKRKKKFKSYPIGFFHIDIAEVRTEEGKLQLFVAIDRTSKFVMTKLYKRATTESAKAFLEALISAVLYRIHTVLTDNGIQFEEHLDAFTAAYNFDSAKRLKTLKGLTPYEFIVKTWAEEPQRFHHNPNLFNIGLYS